jgi:hypothetical protein
MTRISMIGISMIRISVAAGAFTSVNAKSPGADHRRAFRGALKAMPLLAGPV